MQGFRIKAFVVCCLLFNVCCLGHSCRSSVDKQKTFLGGARKHTCDVDMRRAYTIGSLDSIEDTLKVHMYWLNVQGLRVKAFVVCCLLFNVCCLGHSCRSTVNKLLFLGGARKHTHTHVTLTCGGPMQSGFWIVKKTH